MVTAKTSSIGETFSLVVAELRKAVLRWLCCRGELHPNELYPVKAKILYF
jgi:hypothetical protein